MNWLSGMFGVQKPIIAMCHLQALPGDPAYDRAGGMAKVIELAARDLEHLQAGGVDGVMFSNEFSLPYLTNVKPETTAAMARVIGELRRAIRVPFGVNVLWDPIASIELAAATDAQFMREIVTGVYASDFGLWNTNAGETMRRRAALAPELRMLFNIVPEAASYLGSRTSVDIARTTVFNNRPDALCVSGLTAGVETDTQLMSEIKKAVPDTIVLCNTGCRVDNIERQLKVADGAVVGTAFKVDGRFEKLVDPARVREFMDKVKSIRPAATKLQA
ncbi:MAG TPA: BtpA/SgcQ family protein [Roseiarcus sp.]|nr:BtpA/SgcQ family protein [Roseiarcus sp.]